MFKKLLLATALICSTPAFAAADGFVFRTAEYDRPEVQVDFVLFRTQVELQKEAERLGAYVEDDRKMKAFSVLRVNSNKCTIYMLNPEKDYNPEYIGHELMHCKYGRWHK